MKNEISDNSIKKIITNQQIELSTRIEILKLYNYLNKFSKINFVEKEKEIYNKLGVNDKISKIDFEIKRINQYIENKHPQNSEYEERIKYIKNTYKLIINDTLNNIKINQERLDDLLERIILLELNMEMKVGLYQEIEQLLNKEINNITKQYNLDESIEKNYIKKKDWFNNGTK